jgi:hypothetical protein
MIQLLSPLLSPSRKAYAESPNRQITLSDAIALGSYPVCSWVANAERPLVEDGLDENDLFQQAVDPPSPQLPLVRTNWVTKSHLTPRCAAGLLQ